MDYFVELTDLVNREITLHLDRIPGSKVADFLSYQASRHSMDDSFFLGAAFACSYRSKFLFTSGEIVGLTKDKIVDSAVGIEMIHGSSLVFDDLPCMDDAEVRRGRKCTHVEFGEDIGILAALYLLTKGEYLMISDAERYNRIQPVNQELQDSLHFEGLIGGQEKDLRAKELDLDKDNLLEAYFQKNRLIYFSI
ncbi:unnamed protein product, partial [marine sediment metagenome]